MMKTLKNCLLSCLVLGSVAQGGTILDTKIKTIDGKETTLAAYKPKAVLIVNTASKCGYTRQYAGLEKLSKKYAKDGLVVAGFPCNQFGGQEPGTNADIAEFCSAKFDVSFPMFAKIDVNGPKRHALYEQLAGKDSPFPGKVAWNFTKFLVDADGKVVARFKSGVEPDSDELKAALKKTLK